MPVRKNAKHLTTTERENLVRAFVAMKADIVNPGAPPADRYDRWDQFVAVHRMIQNANTPNAANVNFGHGGWGAYGFLSWHRYFLYVLEQQLRTYLPAGTTLTLPYWDWTDPAPIMTAGFLGPNGDPGSGNEVRQGYFAREAPGTGVNATPAPAWWPAGLTGWSLHAAFGTWAGALRRAVGPVSNLPSVVAIRDALDKTNYPEFQRALEGGTGTSTGHQLHNGLHGWFGAWTQMWHPDASPFDPMFYLHHCNIDRLWALWQMDGHATEYPVSGGDPEHHLTDPMYPWVGTLSGYSSNASLGPIAMPDFSALGVVTPQDVLDHRALGYSYDTQVIVGVSLDCTGSMTAMTPDPMTTGAPDVTKWEAARRGVSAFLQDCEAAYAAAEAYVVAGVKTFRSLLINEFSPVFAGTPYGLVKASGAYSKATFDAAVATQSPGGGTPLADALVDAHATLVTPPFGSLPGDERRYLAFFTDGMLTSGSPLSSVPDGSLADTAVFAMGFGTGADVDYATIAALVAKGQTLSSQQVFHGENAGVIDKFYSQALAAALGFAPVMDPVLELFEGEHVHVDFTATSAEDSFFLTAQGLDFSDDWGYQLIGPDGHVAHASGTAPPHTHGGHGSGHVGRRPLVTARHGSGRLSLFVNRDNADVSAWVGTWMLVVSWRARDLDAMVMTDLGELIVPVAAGPVRGPRWARLLAKSERRKAARAIVAKPRHRFDVQPTSTNRSGRAASSAVVSVYARTRLRVELHPRGDTVVGSPFAVDVAVEALSGGAGIFRSFARLLGPTRPMASALRNLATGKTAKPVRLKDVDGVSFDAGRTLARLEREDPRIGTLRDEEVPVSVHGHGSPHVHVDKVDVPGVYHLGVFVEGAYCPCCGAIGAHEEDAGKGHDEGHGHDGSHGHADERFTRLLAVSTAVEARRPGPKAAKKSKAKARKG